MVIPSAVAWSGWVKDVSHGLSSPCPQRISDGAEGPKVVHAIMGVEHGRGLGSISHSLSRCSIKGIAKVVWLEWRRAAIICTVVHRDSTKGIEWPIGYVAGIQCGSG